MAQHDPGLPAQGKKFNPDVHIADWKGPKKQYDLVKEVVIAFVVVLLLTTCLAVAFSSPDLPPITIQKWASADPVDFLQTAITELNGTSATAQYGPPYNTVKGNSQSIGPVSLEELAGVHLPINTEQDFIIGPLDTITGDPSLSSALAEFRSATSAQQANWESAYVTAAGNATDSNGVVRVPKGSYGPVGVLMSSLLAMARSGGLDGALIASKQFYTTNYTNVLLFLADGGYLGNVAQNRHLLGEQWGMMNETGSYPGQAWLWLYTMWYQIPPFSTSASGDALVWATMMLLTLILLCVPLIPGLRSIPRWIPLYKLVWRDHYRSNSLKK